MIKQLGKVNKILWAILTHQNSIAVEKMLIYWRQLVGDNIIILYGGESQQFDQIVWQRKCKVNDPWLFTKDHQRELQSYCGVFEALRKSVEGECWSHVFFTEYDQIPLRADIGENLLNKMKERKADVLFQGLQRVDGTSYAHWLYKKNRNALELIIPSISVRKNSNIVLSCWGFGQFWKAEVLWHLTDVKNPPRVYLELWIPTLAYHLGYQLERGIGSDEWNKTEYDFFNQLSNLQDTEEFFTHPVKAAWIK